MQKLGADGERRSPPFDAELTLTVAALVTAPHVCLIMSLPPPPEGALFCHGYTYLAADLLSPSRRATNQRPQRAGVGMRSKGGLVEAEGGPLMVLQSSRSRTQSTDWDASFAVQQVKVRNIGLEGLGGQPQRGFYECCEIELFVRFCNSTHEAKCGALAAEDIQPGRRVQDSRSFHPVACRLLAVFNPVQQGLRLYALHPAPFALSQCRAHEASESEALETRPLSLPPTQM